MEKTICQAEQDFTIICKKNLEIEIFETSKVKDTNMANQVLAIPNPITIPQKEILAEKKTETSAPAPAPVSAPESAPKASDLEKCKWEVDASRRDVAELFTFFLNRLAPADSLKPWLHKDATAVMPLTDETITGAQNVIDKYQQIMNTFELKVKHFHMISIELTNHLQDYRSFP